MPFRIGLVFALPLALLTSGANAGPDRSALKQRCGGDYATYCGDLAPDGPEVRACFRRNMTNLSPGCRAEIERLRQGGAKG